MTAVSIFDRIYSLRKAPSDQVEFRATLQPHEAKVADVLWDSSRQQKFQVCGKQAAFRETIAVLESQLNSADAAVIAPLLGPAVAALDHSLKLLEASELAEARSDKDLSRIMDIVKQRTAHRQELEQRKVASHQRRSDESANRTSAVDMRKQEEGEMWRKKHAAKTAEDRARISSLRQKTDGELQKRQHLAAELRALERLTELEEEMERLRQAIEALDDLIAGLEADLEALRQQLDEQTALVVALEAEIKALAELKAKSEAEAKRLQDEAALLDNEANDVETSGKMAAAAIRAAAAAMGAIGAAMANAMASMIEIAAQHQSTALRNRGNQLRTKANERKEAAAKAEASIKEATAKKDAAVTDVAVTTRSMSETSERLRLARDERSSKLAELTKLSTEACKLSKDQLGKEHPSGALVAQLAATSRRTAALDHAVTIAATTAVAKPTNQRA
jgi:archaellum component FlaC